MPENKNALTRCKILDELLSNQYHNYSIDDLVEEVNKRLSDMYPNSNGVGRRAIEKDIKYLEYEGPFMVNIERYSVPSYNKEKQKSYVKRCLRYANPSFSIFKKDLSDDEEYLLREALSLLGQFDGLPNLEALEGLRLVLGNKHNDRKIISLAKNPLGESNLFGKIFTAISQKQVIELHYHKFIESQKKLSIAVCPYLLKEYNRRWFLFAAAESDSKLLCFALDRVDSVVSLPSHKFFDYDGDLDEVFEDIIGVTINSSPVHKIIFWVSDVSKDYVLTKPLHESQRNIYKQEETDLRSRYPMLSNGQFFRIDCKENYELIRELTSFGKELVVLSPTYIREKVIKRIGNMQEIYEKTNFANIEFAGYA